MTMTCTICRHPESQAINAAIVQRVSYRTIARRYGVGYRSVGRHLRCIRRIIREALHSHNET